MRVKKKKIDPAHKSSNRADFIKKCGEHVHFHRFFFSKCKLKYNSVNEGLFHNITKVMFTKIQAYIFRDFFYTSTSNTSPKFIMFTMASLPL